LHTLQAAGAELVELPLIEMRGEGVGPDVMPNRRADAGKRRGGAPRHDADLEHVRGRVLKGWLTSRQRGGVPYRTSS